MARQGSRGADPKKVVSISGGIGNVFMVRKFCFECGIGCEALQLELPPGPSHSSLLHETERGLTHTGWLDIHI